MNVDSPKMVILDRDGTVIEDQHYLSNPSQVVLLPGASEGLKRLTQAGYRLVIASNQSGVGRGYFSMREVDAVNREMVRQLRAEGIEFDGIYICPHRPDEGCSCRKPKPGMMIEAANEIGFDPSASVVIGDKISDLEMGRAVGSLTVLVRTGKGIEEECKLSGQADLVQDNLIHASELILHRLGSRTPDQP